MGRFVQRLCRRGASRTQPWLAGSHRSGSHSATRSSAVKASRGGPFASLTTAARVHPDAGHAPGERSAGAARAEPWRRVGPRELPGPAAVLHRGQTVRRRGPDRRHRPAAGPRDDSPQGGRAMTGQQDDPDLRGPARLSAPRVPVVRLNRRILYIIGGALVVVVLAGLVALRAQGSRLAQDANSHASRPPTPAGERWFDKV